jgi:hypothetical protein
MANPNTPPGWPRFDPVDIVGRKLADEHKADIDLSKLNRAFGNILGDLQALQGGASGGGILTVIQDVHSKRKQDMVEGAAPGSLFLETDRGVIYIRRMTGVSNAWWWLGGIMFATFANQPADLKATDLGFLFHATDTYREYRWSGTAWAETTQGNDAQIAYASGNLVLGAGVGAIADVPGATLTLNRAGRYLINGVFHMQEVGVGDIGQQLVGVGTFDGTPQTQVAIMVGGAQFDQGTVSQQWLYAPATAGKVVKLRGYKAAGGGGSTINTPHTGISALWIGA